MLFAHTASVLKSLAVGGFLLGFTIGAAIAPDDSSRRLVLYAPEEPGAIYHSAWRDGDLTLVGEMRPMRFETRVTMDDTCRWLAIETIEPVNDRMYTYDYDEIMLGCEPGATPRWRATPRSGVVEVID